MKVMQPAELATPELRAELWNLAVETAARKGFGIAPDCATHLRDFIDRGSQRLEAETGFQDPLKVDEARRNLAKFVEGMVATAQAMALTELHEPTFFRTLSILCPLWPFC